MNKVKMSRNDKQRTIQRFSEQTAVIFWHALNKIGQQNYTSWLSGSSLAYSDWKAGNPSAFATENCAAYE
jgi:hypothetical protein